MRGGNVDILGCSLGVVGLEVKRGDVAGESETIGAVLCTLGGRCSACGGFGPYCNIGDWIEPRKSLFRTVEYIVV